MRDWSDYDSFALLFQHQNSDECDLRVTLQHPIRERVRTGVWIPKYFCTKEYVILALVTETRKVWHRIVMQLH